MIVTIDSILVAMSRCTETTSTLDQSSTAESNRATTCLLDTPSVLGPRARALQQADDHEILHCQTVLSLET